MIILVRVSMSLPFNDEESFMEAAESLCFKMIRMHFSKWIVLLVVVVLYHFDHMFTACDALRQKFAGQKFTDRCDA
jgi:hypothetical protein